MSFISQWEVIVADTETENGHEQKEVDRCVFGQYSWSGILEHCMVVPNGKEED